MEHPVASRYSGSSILIVDDELGMRNFLQKSLVRECGLVEVADSVESAEALRQRCHFDLIIMDIRLSGESGVEWIQELRGYGVQTDVIFMTAFADMETAIQALRTGAADFILKPFRVEQMLSSVKNCLEKQRLTRDNFVLQRQLDQYYEMDGMIGASDAIKDVCSIIKRVAPSPTTLLIEGQSGTGKELAARALHEFSGRKGAFVPINCGSISPELLESELFGHVKGAFTGAHQSRQGLFNYASGGTIFLDEIGEMPLAMQAKLLRVLEEHAIRPVGSEREISIDVRIIAATNRDLESEVEKGQFREDLFYRLNVVSIRMPSLAERKDDIPLLARYFSDTLSAQLGVAAIPFNHQDLIGLQSYNWPGNIRELKNIIERSLLLGRTPLNCINKNSTDNNHAEKSLGMEYPDNWTMQDVEKHHMQNVLKTVDGNKSEAARRLGVSRKTLERKFQTWN
ncbi:MAG: sigma-54 dependent transcriptional regulator [Gammaproteobacteria bacterium]|nr:sigma-54 dependent transcriptional regulator [Gammaproteobacteria bacterium]MDH5660818.1 sigma-54 dependent transcriptional regulator [Gammaproteobacteria bacterium]